MSEENKVDEIIALMTRQANRKPSDLNAWVIGSFLELVAAIRQEYNEGFTATFQAIEDVQRGVPDDVELLKRGQKLVGEMALFIDKVFQANGLLDANGPTEKMLVEDREAFQQLRVEITDFVSSAEAYIVDADSDDDGDDDDEDDDEDDEEDALEAPKPAVTP